MNETLNTLLTRRSIRKFKPEMVDESILDEIMKAGTFAPTGMGKQSPIIICIKDPELLDEIRKENAELLELNTKLKEASSIPSEEMVSALPCLARFFFPFANVTVPMLFGALVFLMVTLYAPPFTPFTVL